MPGKRHYPWSPGQGDLERHLRGTAGDMRRLRAASRLQCQRTMSAMPTNEEFEAAIRAAVPTLTSVGLVVIAGQKRVYKGSEPGGDIALKLILIGEETQTPPEGDEGETADALSAGGARLQREIEILRKCESPHIVKLSEPEFAEISIAGERYGLYGEEWVDGEDLHAILLRGTLSRQDVIEWG